MANLFGGITDAAGNVLDYLGGNLQNSQDLEAAAVKRENAITDIELEKAKREGEQKKEVMKIAKDSLKFLGIILMLIVVSKFIIPEIAKAVK